MIPQYCSAVRYDAPARPGDRTSSFCGYLEVSGIFITVALSYTGGLQGTGDTRSPLYISIMSQVVDSAQALFRIFEATRGLEPGNIWLAILERPLHARGLSVMRFRQGKWQTRGQYWAGEAVIRNAKCKIQNANADLSAKDLIKVKAATPQFPREFASQAIGALPAPICGMPTDLSQDIRDRTFKFACAVATLVLSFNNHRLRWIVDQLLRSATSVGANLGERSRPDLQGRILPSVKCSTLTRSRETLSGCGYALN